MAQATTQRTKRMGPINDQHKLFNARIGTFVVAGSAPPDQIEDVEKALGAEEFVAFDPKPGGLLF